MSSQRTCSACGKSTPEEALFCIHCGAMKPRRRIPALTLFLVAVLVVACLFLLVVLTKPPIIAGIGGRFGEGTTIVIEKGQETATPSPDDTATATLVATGTANGAPPPPTKTPLPTPTPSRTPTPTAVAADVDAIVFIRVPGDSDGDGTLDWDGNRVICRVDADGGDEHCLTDDSYSSSSPHWSPDGRHIAFSSDMDGDPEIYLMNADGSGRQQLTDNTAPDLGPNWSPDGAWIVFHRYIDDDVVELFRMRPDGSEQTQITHTGGQNRYPAWSTNGLIAFEAGSLDPIDEDIYLTDAGGSFVERLTATGYSVGASWSPDGRYLAYSTGEPVGAHLAILDTVTGETIHLTNDNDAEPYWSPDSRRLVYSRWEPRLPQLWVYELDTGSSWQLTVNDGYMDTQPAWSP